jgi:hypothetical protein
MRTFRFWLRDTPNNICAYIVVDAPTFHQAQSYISGMTGSRVLSLQWDTAEEKEYQGIPVAGWGPVTKD